MKTLVKALREVAALQEKLESMRDRKNSIVDLQQRLTAAEQRIVTFTTLLRQVLPHVWRTESSSKLCAKIEDALKPTESSPAQVALSQDNQRIVPVEPMINTTAYDGFDNGSD